MKYSVLISRINQYKGVLLPRKRIILLAMVLLGMIFFVWAYFSTVTFTATTIFHPVASSESLMGGIANPLNLLSGTTDPGMEAMQMIGVLKSRSLSEAVASDSVIFRNEPRLMAEVILELNPTKFSLIGWIMKLIFPPKPLTQQKKIIKAASRIRKLVAVETNPEGFIKFTFENESSFLVQHISERYIEQLTQYYKTQKTEKAQNNLKFFTYRSDSIYKELEKATAYVARHYDRNQNLTRLSSGLKVREKEIESEYLRQLFLQTTASKEEAVAQLQRDTPIIQILDYPVPPFKARKASMFVNLVLGFFLGAFISMVYFSRKLIREDLINFIKSTLDKEAEPEVVTSE